MARKYRKVEAAVQELRRAYGALTAVDPGQPDTAYAAVGSCTAYVARALDLLQADTYVAPSPAFVEGFDLVGIIALNEPLQGI
jgi:hypothetical protein